MFSRFLIRDTDSDSDTCPPGAPTTTQTIARHFPSPIPVAANMHAALLLSTLVALFATAVSSTALTYKLAANEKSCFFAHVNQKSAKVAFYFAVRRRLPRPTHTTLNRLAL